jgi:predicted RNA-binding Zn ribbon-like protein
LADNKKTEAANIQFKKVQRVEEGKKAMVEYESAAVALRTKTDRLKALRLEKEAAEETALADLAAATKKKPARKAKEKPASLSGWIKDQADGGRNN